MLTRFLHPREILKDELAKTRVNPTSFARQIDVPSNRISPDHLMQTFRTLRRRSPIRPLGRSRASILVEPPGPIRSRRHRPAYRGGRTRTAGRPSDALASARNCE